MAPWLARAWQPGHPHRPQRQRARGTQARFDPPSTQNPRPSGSHMWSGLHMGFAETREPVRSMCERYQPLWEPRRACSSPIWANSLLSRAWRTVVVVNLALWTTWFYPDPLCAKWAHWQREIASLLLPATDRPRSQCYLRRVPQVRSACWPLVAGVGGEFGALEEH